MGKLDGKVAVVTGASRGIGEAIAMLFAAEGARVACVARTVQEGDHQTFPGSLEKTVAEIRDAGGEAEAFVANLADADDVSGILPGVREALGPIDVLVNNAAQTYYYPIAEFPIRRWLRMFDVCVHAPMMLMQDALQDMIPRKSGAIVNISSGSAVGPGRGPYGAADERTASQTNVTGYGTVKAALDRLTQGTASEVYEHGISVTALGPSQTVLTPAAEFRGFDGRADAASAAAFEQPDMMARATLLLATEPVDAVTGRVAYSQAILKEFGWIDEGRGGGIDRPLAGFAAL